ncbi:MAG: VOC family protein [Armatimonadota bacterium]
MTTARILSVAPMLNVADSIAEVTFFRDVLGFVNVHDEPGYAVMQRDGTNIHIAETNDAEVLSHVKGRMQIYVQTDDIDALWERAKPFSSTYRTRDLFEREYGMTEFHMETPGGILVFVAEGTGHRLERLAAKGS